MAKTSLPPPEKIDPEQAWQPWQPSDADPWDLKWAGHLYRRAGFGATPAELHAAVKDGLPATFDRLFRTDAEAEERYQFLTVNGERVAGQNNAYQLRGWWLYAMLNTLQPAREKLALFWHNHFATSIAKVQRTGLMYGQNRLLRQHALGKFGPFLQAISKDPAMLVWLDNNSNVKSHPNENYAREVMELFTLGTGNYTEHDIREAARAFTGWHTDGDQFDFNPSLHDFGQKTVLGQTGNWNGDDVVRILLEQPAASRFLVRKLYHYLVSEAHEPSPALLEPLAAAFRKSDYDIGALVKTMLRSRLFFSEHAYRQRIKCPVEYVVCAVRSVGQGFVSPQSLVKKLEAMGQDLFAPPNVKGWVMGRAWLNTATVLARANFAQSLAAGTGQLNLSDPTATIGVAVDPAALLRREGVTDPVRIVAYLAEVLLDGELGDAARARLIAYVAEGKPQGPALDQRVRDAVHSIMTMPEYELA
ncbi:MAG TPA: DUF1800 domain-containing protein [Gemmataceae bacterium]|nr:DUF1800 domain-containing protein [Gemmataceae bacterium]